MRVRNLSRISLKEANVSALEFQWNDGGIRCGTSCKLCMIMEPRVSDGGFLAIIFGSLGLINLINLRKHRIQCMIHVSVVITYERISQKHIHIFQETSCEYEPQKFRVSC